MECKYFAEVHIKLSGSLYTTKVPPAVLPFIVLTPNIAGPQIKMPPPNQWKPHVEAPINFMIPEQS